jgi:hypothetical protein
MSKRKRKRLKLQLLRLQKRSARKKPTVMMNGLTKNEGINKKFERVFCVLFANQVNSPFDISIRKKLLLTCHFTHASEIR